MNKIRIATNEKALTVRLLADICDDVCLHSPLADRAHDAECRSCPVNELVRLIDI